MTPRLVTLFVVGWFSCAAIGADKSDFPWLMTPYKYAHLNPEQRRIYLNAYFEAAGFVLYNYAPREAAGAMKNLNIWIDCVTETRNKETWSPDLDWVFGKNLDKSVAYVLYNTVSPLVCKEYAEKAGTTDKMLRIYTYRDWKEWSTKEKAVYVSGYIDTVASFQMRLRDAGAPNDLKDLRIVIEVTGIGGIVSDVMKIQFEPQYPLPWSVSRGLGAARDRILSK
jgi:hypothetical protein